MIDVSIKYMANRKYKFRELYTCWPKILPLLLLKLIF